MKRLMVALVVLAGLSGAAAAASVTNGDGEAVLLKVTEGSQQSELAVGPGETVEFCASGCFVTMPNGDREALSGTEKVTISGGKATVN
ncbi:MAG: hypothetical protein JNJ53_10005 [Rhizobiales bacterium]|nr:hypothetical protein [Hyphomicrobiales bacterium]